ncbi:MAG TPA: hypothetical protein VMB03_27605 [Bryobacteraceae bacterium]|nr:hypothetical protein [Bryobacteraceae bacterium]
MTSEWNDTAESPSTPLLQRWDGIARRYFGGIAFSLTAFVFLVEWVPILFGGLWLDESFTWWQAHRGWHNAWAAASASPGTSPLFAALCSWFYFGPGKHMELWLRIPAFLAMLTAAFLVFRLADAWFGRNAAWLALVMFVSDKDIISRATEARPYGLALAACLGLMYGLHIWLSEKRVWAWLLFVASAILIPYWHFLFAAFFVVPAAYLAVWRFSGHKLPWLALGGSAILIAAAWLPLRGQFLALQSAGHALSFADMPNIDTFIGILLPPRFVISAFLAVLTVQLILGDQLASPLRRWRYLSLAAAFWMFSGPVELFAASELRGYGMLVERYVIYIVAGMVLLAASYFARARLYTSQAAVLGIFAGFSILAAASHHWRGPSLGSWREPAHEISRIDPPGNVPVVVASGFVESNSLDWQDSTGANSYLYAPLQIYPISNRWYPLPYKLDAAAKAQTDRLLDGALNGRARIFFLASMPTDLTQWVTEHMEDRHYTAHWVSPDSIVLIEFDRN